MGKSPFELATGQQPVTPITLAESYTESSPGALKVHFRRIIAPHTDVNLGDCSFLDTCRHMKTCKYVHYELDPMDDVSPMMGTSTLHPSKALKP
ncbi:putative N6-adenosine-methyltransferase MT-A70-like [Drosera capensis]